MWQMRQSRFDLGKGQASALGYAYHGDAPQHPAGKPPLISRAATTVNQALGLVEVDR